MNTTTRKWTKMAIAIAVATLIRLEVKAQNTQEGSVWAPAGLKVDGKLTEWGNALQANNKTTLLNYTVANDENNLYLAIKSTDQNNSRKILAGGITFSINTDGKKKDEDAYAITYPVINRETMRGAARRAGFGGPGGPGGPGGGPGGPPPSSSTTDSAMRAGMRNVLSGAKELHIRGFKDIPDSVISIYNEYSIKAAVNYDENGNFIYELAIPLKLMGLHAGDSKQLAYNLKVNGIQFNRNRNENRDGGENGGGGFGGGNRGGGGDGGGGNRGGGGGGGRGGFGGGGGGGFGGGGFGGGRGGFGGMNMADMFNPTDFWAKYTLAKKQ